jgi:hypothetical protein
MTRPVVDRIRHTESRLARNHEPFFQRILERLRTASWDCARRSSKLDDQLRNCHRCRVLAIDQPELARCDLKCRRQIRNVVRPKRGRIVVFEDRSNWHV